jgi:hypothetical protein
LDSLAYLCGKLLDGRDFIHLVGGQLAGDAEKTAATEID